jgi:hypothetical protein
VIAKREGSAALSAADPSETAIMGQPRDVAAHLYTVEELDWYLRRQSGVISCAQARLVGLSQDMVDRRIASRRWERLHPSVYLSADHPYTDEVRMWAPVLWAGKDAVVQGQVPERGVSRFDA